MFGTHDPLQVWTSNPFSGSETLTLTSYGILGAFAYSIKTEGNIIKHVKINKNNNKFQLDQPDENGTGVAKQFDSLEELVDHYKEYGMVDTATSLIRPDTPGQNSHMDQFYRSKFTDHFSSNFGHIGGTYLPKKHGFGKRERIDRLFRRIFRATTV